MPRGACLLGGGREEVIAALDGQLALIFACCAPGCSPEDRARVREAATA